jgi:putative transposase
LRELARGGIRLVLEGDARGTGRGSSAWDGARAAASSKSYRNGYYIRDLVITTDRLKELQVPRDREGQFHTQVFERYRQEAPQVAEATHRDVRRWCKYAASARKVAETLMGVAPSASAISRLNRDLEQQFTAWSERWMNCLWLLRSTGQTSPEGA